MKNRRGDTGRSRGRPTDRLAPLRRLQLPPSRPISISELTFILRTIPLNRIIPLILAVALFMENMDSTMISTALPAIAHDIHVDPIALKLALASYLVALAIFIPISGWMADRFGAKRVFRHAIVVFMAGSLCCAVSGIADAIRPRPLPAGHGRRDDGAGGAPGARANHEPQRTRLCDGAAHDPGPDRSDDRTAARRLHHHLFQLALDLPDQHADRHRGHRDVDDPSCRRSRARRRPPDRRRRLPPRRRRRLGLVFGLSVISLPAPAAARSASASASSGSSAGVLYLRHAARHPAPLLDLSLFRKSQTFRTSVLGGTMFRVGTAPCPS